MSADVVRLGLIIEGDGEEPAVPNLIRKICGEVLGFYALKIMRPVRISRSKLLRDGELEKAIRYVQMQTLGPILVLVDADDDCPATLGPDLKSKSIAVAGHPNVSVVMPKYEFETWFIAAVQSLSGKRGLRQDLVPPTDPESIRGAKEWLRKNMARGKTYSPSIDQVAFVAGMDLTAARSCRSFDRLCREIERLVRS
jgi:Domain of unknown function (DUF4276)